MAELIIFTLLATIVAIYSILPRSRQLRVTYSLWNKPAIAVLSIFGFTILASYVTSLFLQNTDRETIWNINTTYFSTSIEIALLEIELIQLASTLAIMAIFLSVFGRKSVRIRNEEVLLSTLRDLYNRGEYSTLVDIIRDNYTPLINHPKKPVPPSEQVWRDIDVTFNYELVETDEEVEEIDNTQPFIQYIESEGEERNLRERVGDGVELKRRQARFWVKMALYRLAETAEAASGYTEALLLDPDFSAEHPILDPGLGIDIISDTKLEGFRRRDVTHQYLTTLLRTENSLLYREIANNMSMEGIYRYRVKQENRLLYALLSDCSRAEELDAYKPIGDTAKDILREQGSKDNDKYNERRLLSSNRSKDYVLNDPVFVAISFFDIMVRESFYQRVDWHMWLFYYESMTRLICENYEITPESEPGSEWPNDYSRFLYGMMSNMADLLRIMEMMVQNDEFDISNEDGEYADFINLESYRRDRGGNIPKSAVMILFSCHKEIIMTPRIPHQFKEYITEHLFEICSSLRDHEEESLPWKYSEFMLRRLEAMINGREGEKYRRELELVYNDGVRHEVVASGATGGWIVDDLDELIRRR